MSNSFFEEVFAYRRKFQRENLKDPKNIELGLSQKRKFKEYAENNSWIKVDQKNTTGKHIKSDFILGMKIKYTKKNHIRVF